MTKLEAVARAIDPEVWGKTPEYKAIKKSLDRARAALMAMKGPTEKMVLAGVYGTDDDAATYNQMIDAALEGQ